MHNCAVSARGDEMDTRNVLPVVLVFGFFSCTGPSADDTEDELARLEGDGSKADSVNAPPINVGYEGISPTFDLIGSGLTFGYDGHLDFSDAWGPSTKSEPLVERVFQAYCMAGSVYDITFVKDDPTSPRKLLVFSFDQQIADAAYMNAPFPRSGEPPANAFKQVASSGDSNVLTYKCPFTSPVTQDNSHFTILLGTYYKGPFKLIAHKTKQSPPEVLALYKDGPLYGVGNDSCANKVDGTPVCCTYQADHVLAGAICQCKGGQSGDVIQGCGESYLTQASGDGSSGASWLPNSCGLPDGVSDWSTPERQCYPSGI